MNINQIKYFLVAAQCLSFTKAANQLYITQPALSRQIQIMEEELGVLLFVRTSRRMQLTPAGVILKERFKSIYDNYTDAVVKARNAYQGLTGELRVGILEGTYVGDLFPHVLQYFSDRYPNVDIKISNYSFGTLVDKLNCDELDLILTLRFDIEKLADVDYRVVQKTRDHIVVHKDHPLAKQDSVKLEDLKGETFIMVSIEDSTVSSRLILDGFKRSGVVPRVKFAPSIQAVMLWIQANVGVGMLDSRNIMFNSPTVKFLDVAPVSDPSLVLAWNKDTNNPYVPIFYQNFTYIDAQKSKKE